MTNLEHILNKLKQIEPERDYADRSLHTIVMSPRKSKTSWFSFTFFRVAEYGAAVALVGLLFFVMMGNSSLVQLFSPIQSSSLSSGGLRAEAEAIDIQIKLLGVDYTEGALIVASSTPKTVAARKKIVKTAPVAITPNETSTIEAVTSTPSPAVEDVLELLAE